MKKIAIAIAIMLAFSAFAMAGEVVVSGSATTTFGYNLDASTYGLTSDVSSDVSMTVGEADAESMGEGAWYGVIELTGASISWNSGNGAEGDYGYNQWEADVDGNFTIDNGVVAMPFAVVAPSVAAKITDGNLYAMLQSEAGFAADYVAGVDNDPMEFTAPSVAGSWTLGGMFGPASVAVELATAGSYEDTTQADGVALGTTVGLDLAPLAVNFAFAGGFGYAATQEMGIALQVIADLAPATVTAAFDYLVEASSYEASLGVAADLAPLTVGADLYYATDDVDTSVSVGYADDAMGVDLAVGAYDLTTTLVWNVALDLTYAVNSGVALAAGFSMDSADMMAAYANASLTEVIDNVTFTLGWENADDLQSVSAADTDLGQVIFATNIAY